MNQGPANLRGLFFISCGVRATIYAAVSMYSFGCCSNSFRHSSEQKVYFFPANCDWNSGFLSSTSIPQTGSIVICVSVVEIRLLCFNCQQRLFRSHGFQVTEHICLSSHGSSHNQAGPSAKGKFFPALCSLYSPRAPRGIADRLVPARSSPRMTAFPVT